MTWWGVLLLAGVLLFFVYPWVQAKRQKGKQIPGDLATELDSQSLNPGILYFYGKNCAPCRTMAPRIKNLESKGFSVRSVAIEDIGPKIMKMGIMSTPTTLIVKNNRILEIMIGLKDESDLENRLKAASL